MTGSDYKAIRTDLDMTREQLANALGITSSTVFRRECGESIGQEAETAILSLQAQHAAAQPGAE